METGKFAFSVDVAVAARPAILFENAFPGNSRKSGCSPKARPALENGFPGESNENPVHVQVLPRGSNESISDGWSLTDCLNGNTLPLPA